MKCPPERALEKAAARLLAMGIGLEGQGLESRRLREEHLESAPPSMRGLLRHAMECVRCRELLTIFQATETGLAEELAREEAALKDGAPELLKQNGAAISETVASGHSVDGTRTGQIIELRPIRSQRLSPAAPDAGAREYRVAADTGPESETSEIAAEAPVLSLESEDGRFVVRIFVREPGPGAVAVLLRSHDLQDSREDDKDLPKLFLRVGNEQYAFAEDGSARLPRFPAEKIALLVR